MPSVGVEPTRFFRATVSAEGEIRTLNILSLSEATLPVGLLRLVFISTEIFSL